jgi:hypothetical protein
MHLEITAQVPGPFRPDGEQLPRLGARDEIPSNRRDSLAELRRLIKPPLDLSFYERANSSEFSEWPVLVCEIHHVFRPQKRSAGGAPKSAL